MTLTLPDIIVSVILATCWFAFFGVVGYIVWINIKDDKRKGRDDR